MVIMASGAQGLYPWAAQTLPTSQEPVRFALDRQARKTVSG